MIPNDAWYRNVLLTFYFPSINDVIIFYSTSKMEELNPTGPSVNLRIASDDRKRIKFYCNLFYKALSTLLYASKRHYIHLRFTRMWTQILGQDVITIFFQNAYNIYFLQRPILPGYSTYPFKLVYTQYQHKSWLR